MANRSFYFDPWASDLAVFLGPTEATLMELAWTHGEITVKKAIRLLGPESDLAYTTVMTVLNRLTGKGYLNREKDGRFFIYRPVQDRRQFIQDRVKIIKDCLKANFG